MGEGGRVGERSEGVRKRYGCREAWEGVKPLAHISADFHYHNRIIQA